MAIKVSSVSETYGKDVFTNKGMFCGKLEDLECDLKRFKVRSLVVKAARESYISKMLGNKKGVIIPFPMVESIGDIVLIKHISLPVSDEEASAQPHESVDSAAMG